MHERYKLTEARHFLTRMLVERDNPTNFRFELSAFLAAARSVLQYVLKEADTVTGGKLWYAKVMTRDPLLVFFKDQRDANIHTAPVSPATNMSTHIAEYLCIEEDNGEDTIVPLRHYTSSYRHRFTAWAGNEDVLELAERYLVALQVLVEDGVSQGFISG